MANDKPVSPGNLSGKPWSATDIADLQKDLRLGTPIEQIANFLCRELDEVQHKLAELEQGASDFTNAGPKQPGTSHSGQR
jgi:hypothetical protein